MTIAGDRVCVTTTVAVEPALAFEVFTQEIDRWWRRGVRYRASGRTPGVLVLEPWVGGRLFEEYAGPTGPAVHEAGRVIAWAPPSHLAFEWRGANFVAGEVTVVDVTFEPTDSGTQVMLVHRGFAALRADHPIRHGADVTAFIRMIGMWWSDHLTSLREHVRDRAESSVTAPAT